MIRRTALLTFHRDWNVCLARIRLLRALNPNIEVHALFGGEPSDYTQAVQHVQPHVDSLIACTLGSGRWRWQHTDLVVRDWYAKHGHVVDFDVLHLVQWDLLLFAPLAHLYHHVPPEAIALTGITVVDDIADRWHWTTVEPHRTETQLLFARARTSWGYDATAKACLGPGAALPRSFLNRYIAEEIPELGHDEVRLPLFGELFGHRLVDTRFYPRWFDETTERFFNANGAELPVSAVKEELEHPRGARAFHPCRDSFDQDVVSKLLSITLAPPFRHGAESGAPDRSAY